MESLVRELLAQAPSGAWERGLQWYFAAHEWVRGLASRAGLPIEAVAAVTAALSPRLRWEDNLSEAEALVLGIPRTFRSLGAQRQKALRIIEVAQSGDLDRLTEAIQEGTRGPKVSAFYDNILRPWESERATLDSHMQALLGLPSSLFKPSVYARCEEEFRQACRIVRPDLRPHQIQAILWESRRMALYPRQYL